MYNIQEKDAAWHIHKRKIKKIRLFIMGMIMVIFAVITICIYFKLKQDEYISYTEKAKVNYLVELNENDFYDKTYVEENTNVVATLIKNIGAIFKYDLEFEKENTCIYEYKITERISVKEDKKTSYIYDTEEEILVSKPKEITSNKLQIAEKVDIDYNSYNSKIKRFVKVYGLNDANCTLELTMYLNVYNKYDNKLINKEEKIMTLYIPLTTKTVDISISANTLYNDGKVLEKKSLYGDVVVLKILSIIFGLTAIALLIKLIKYSNDTKSAEKMYEQTLKNILFSYKQHIQKITTNLDEEKYKTIEVESFNEILEMKETLNAPILMYTEKNTRRTKFMIINKELLFVYVLGSKEIREKLIKESKKRKNKQKGV